jgi:hypothetical protein
VGAALMAKYTIGAVSTVLLLPLVAELGVDRWSLVAAAGALTVVVALSVAPIAIHERGIRSMLWRLGPGKQSFLDHGRLGMWQSMRSTRPYYVLLMGVAPFAVASLVVTLMTWRDGAPGRDPLVALWALGVWWACTWPRCDTAHVRSGLPFAALAVAVALRVVHARHRGSRGPGGDVQGCRGAQWPLPDENVERLAIASRIAGGRALVLGRSAPIAYLVSGIHDPTPFDYPLASTFGPHGQQQVVEALADGRIHHVVEVLPLPEEMAPTLIDAWVQANTDVVWQMGLIRLRRPRREPSATPD